MSVRVNLLPEATKAAGRASRQRNALFAGVLLLVAALGGAYLAQGRSLTRAQDDEVAAQARVAELQADRADLQDFADLEVQVEEGRTAVATSMAGEFSMAAILQDVAAVTPSDTALTDLDVTRIAQTAADGETVRPVIARIVAGGESLAGHAPGLERVLLEFDKVAAFFDPYVTSAAADEDDPDVSIFSFEVEIGEEAHTGRYADGLPEELR